MNRDQHSQFDSLMSKLLEESISPDEFQSLQSLIGENPLLYDRYLELIQLHTDLIWDSKTSEETSRQSEFAPTNNSNDSSSSRGKLVSFALALSLLFIITWVFLPDWFHSKPKTIALTLTRQVNCRWENGQEKNPFESGSLRTGQVVKLTEGIAELEFSSGEQLTVYSPAIFRMEDQHRCFFEQGRFALRRRNSNKLKLSTPMVQSISNGRHLAFDVKLDQNQTSVAAIEGNAEIITKKRTNKKILEKSIAMIGKDGEVQIQELEKSFWSVPRSLPEISRVLRKNMQSVRPKFAWTRLDGYWSVGTNWKGGEVPSPKSSVRISRGVTVSVDVDSFAGEIFIGAANLSIIDAHLKVQGLSGDFDVGFRPVPSEIENENGKLSVEGRIILRRNANLKQNFGATNIRSDLFFVDGNSVLEITGNSSTTLSANSFFGMDQSDRIKITSSGNEVPTVLIKQVLQVSGTLDLDLGSIETPSDVILLLDNQGDFPIQGRFQNRKEGDRLTVGGKPYRFSYRHCHSGDAKNDIALIRIKEAKR